MKNISHMKTLRKLSGNTQATASRLLCINQSTYSRQETSLSLREEDGRKFIRFYHTSPAFVVAKTLHIPAYPDENPSSSVPVRYF